VRRGEKLWVPDDNQSQTDFAFVSEYFPSSRRLEVLQLRRADGGSVLNPATFDLFNRLHERIVSAVWNNNGDIPYLPDQVTYSTLCLNRNSQEGAPDFRQCVIQNPIELFGYDKTLWRTEEALLTFLNSPAQWDTDLVEPGFVPSTVLGGLVQEGNKIASAQVLAGYYFLAGNRTLYEQQKEDEPALAWEDVYLNILEVRQRSRAAAARRGRHAGASACKRMHQY
jgi:hypothetical protein